MVQEKDNLNKKEEKARGREFRGAVFPFFMKISFLILFFGVVPSALFTIFIISSFNFHLNKFIKDVTSSPAEKLNFLAESFEKSLQTIYFQTALAFFAFLVVVFIVAIFASRSLTGSIRRLIFGMNRLRQGDYNVSLPLVSRDEIGLLSQEFNLMVEQLKELRERERALSKAKTELIALTAHQFRTPLSAMKWSLGTIKDADIGNLTPLQIELFEKTYSANERMIKLISDMLDVIKIEEGRFGFVFKEEDLQAVTREAVMQFEQLSNQKNITIQFISSVPGTLKCRLDREKIILAISNILENAINYTPEGGSVSLVLEKEQNMAKIIVRDTGIGVPKDESEKLFTKFFRASNVLQLDVIGSGLGLVITKNIIEAHKGKIEIESEEGKGTVVSLYLPLRKKMPLPETEAPFRELVGE